MLLHLFFFVTVTILSILPAALELNPKLKACADRLLFESTIDSDQEFQDSDEDQDNQDLALDLDDREELILDLLKNKKREKIDFFSIIKLTELTEGFTSNDIKLLISTAEKLSGKKDISTESLFLAYYFLKSDSEIPFVLRHYALSQYFLPKYSISDKLPSLDRLIQIQKPPITFSFLNQFFKRVRRFSKFENLPIDDQIIRKVLAAYFELFNISNINLDGITIPSTRSKDNCIITFPEQYIKHKQDNRFQLTVSNQMDAKGGGSLSCGYHAIKNGKCIAEALISNNLNELTSLTAEEFIKTNFGQNESALRKYIVKHRKADLLSRLFSDILLSHFLRGEKRILEQTQRPDGADALVYKLNFSNKWIIFNSINPEEDLCRFKLRECIPHLMNTFYQSALPFLDKDFSSVNALINANLQNLLKCISDRLVNNQDNATYKRLNNLEYIKSFFPSLLHNITFNIDNTTIKAFINNNEQITNLGQIPNDIYSTEIGKNGDLLGENLNGEEIKKLFKYLSDLNKPKDSKIESKEQSKNITFDIINISDDNGQSPFREIDAKLLKEISDSNINKIIVFNVHLPNHWITCVMHKQGESIRYYICDSNANTNQINHPLILRLIYYLETGINEINAAIKLSNVKEGVKPDSADISSAIDVINKNKLTFDLDKDYIGELPAAVTEAINDLQGKNGKKTRHSLYLYGAPGLGKTSIAMGIAKKLNRTIIKCASAKAINKYQGSGVATIEILFKLAKQIGEPVIILIEEIDTISKQRSLQAGEEITRTVMSLTDELDKYKDDTDIFVIATTNNASMVDRALDSRLRDSLNVEILPLTPANALAMLVKKCSENYKIKITDEIKKELTALLSNLDARAINGIVNKVMVNTKNQVPTLQQWKAAVDEHKKLTEEQNRLAEQEKRSKELALRIQEKQLDQFAKSSHDTIPQGFRENIQAFVNILRFFKIIPI